MAEVDMMVRLHFFSDTNRMQAESELELLDLESMQNDGADLIINSQEFTALEEPIMAVLQAWGGTVDF